MAFFVFFTATTRTFFISANLTRDIIPYTPRILTIGASASNRMLIVPMGSRRQRNTPRKSVVYGDYTLDYIPISRQKLSISSNL